MYKIIGGDGREYGPVSIEQLRQWIAEGRANAQTRVQPEGSTDWLPLSEVPELVDALAGAPHPAPASPPADTRLLREQILARGYRVAMGDWINGGWRLLTRNAGTLIGATLLVGVIIIGVSVLSEAGQFLVREGGRHRPVLMGLGLALMGAGWIGNAILSGPLYGGLYWVFLQRRRGVAVPIGDVFAGFRRGFLQLVLVSIVTGLLAALCVVPGAISLAIGFGVRVGGGAGPLATGLLALGGFLALVGILAAVYLSVAWIFSLPLVVDQRLGFWEAMNFSRKQVSRHWWGVFGASIVFGLITIAGALACCVGLIFTIPLFFAMMMCAYEDLFGTGTTATA